MAELIWSPDALDQIDEIADYIARDSESTSKMVTEEIFKTGRLAADVPLVGSIVPEYGKVSIRERLTCGYRVIYRVRSQSVEVIMVYRGSRPLPKRLP